MKLSSIMKQHFTEKIRFVKGLHRPIRKNFPSPLTNTKGFDYLWQSDLAQLDL